MAPPLPAQCHTHFDYKRNDLEDHDETERGLQATQGRLLIGVDLGHARVRLPLRWLVPPGSELEVDLVALVALELDVVDLALAVLLAARLEGEHLRVLREVLDLTQHLSNVIPQG
jgi:hypothetical protein